MHAAAPTASPRLTIPTAILAVINIPELFVVGADELVRTVERKGLVVRLPGIVESPKLFVADAEVVPSGGVGGILFRRLLELNHRLRPQTLLGARDAPFDIFLGLRPTVGEGRRRERHDQSRCEPQT